MVCEIEMKRKIKIWWLFTAAGMILLLVYLCATTYLWARQATFIYRPVRAIVSSPADYGVPFEDLYIPVKGKNDGEENIHAWLMPADPSPDKYLLYLHGRALNIGANINHAQRFRKMGLSVLLISYRGYGKSDRSFPAEATIYSDAEAAWTYLVTQKQISPQSIFVYGHSLGGAVAINLAVDHPNAGGLIVESAFTSIVDMAKLMPEYRVFPLNLIVNQRFDSKKKVTRLQVPTLYIHGTHDRRVPHQMTRVLYELTTSTKKMKLIQGGGHNNNAIVGGEEYLRAVRKFIKFAFKNN